MKIWLRRLLPASVAGLALVGIYLIFQPSGNAPAPKEAAASGLAAFITHAEPKPLPELTFVDGEGRPLTLDAFRGKVVLLNLWATWCAPCRKEMPDLAKLEQALGGADFAVVAVSIDRKGAEASAAFLKETGADSLKLYTDVSARIVTDLKSPGLPTTLLISRDGRELGRLMGPAEWAAPEAIELVRKAVGAP